MFRVGQTLEPTPSRYAAGSLPRKFPSSRRAGERNGPEEEKPQVTFSADEQPRLPPPGQLKTRKQNTPPGLECSSRQPQTSDFFRHLAEQTFCKKPPSSQASRNPQNSFQGLPVSSSKKVVSKTTKDAQKKGFTSKNQEK